jgi:hypothetical protein
MNIHKIVFQNRRGRKDNRKTQKIMFKWIFEELSISLVFVNCKRLFLSRIFSKTITIGKYKAITSLVVLCGFKTWLLFQGKRINYKCLKASCSGKYVDLKRLKA